MKTLINYYYYSIKKQKKSTQLVNYYVYETIFHFVFKSNAKYQQKKFLLT